jgi:hypothetical protein
MTIAERRIQLEQAKATEERAIALAVQLGGGASARLALATALRTWRNASPVGFARAKWLRNHVAFITGHLFK